MAKTQNIIKRDGSKVLFDVMKVKKVIEWAIKDLTVNSLELESQLQLNLREGTTTEELQQILINCAVGLTNIEDLKNLEWRFAASRLLLLNMYKKAKELRPYLKFKNDDVFDFGSYYKFVSKAVKDNLYSKIILEEYTKEELDEIGEIRLMDYDRRFDYSGMNLLSERYLIKNNSKIFELPQDMYLTISLYLAIPEKKKDRLKIAKEFYYSLAARKISPATPIILNLRKPKGNLSSCFITAMDDSLDSIYYTLDQLAQISKNGGGVGVNVSRIRCQGAYIKHHKGASGGVIPWVKLINDTAVAVNQLGSRIGAITVALDIWHMDIENFLDIQSENGDPRTKAFDIFPQIVVCDEFLRRVEEDKLWTLIDPHEIGKKYNVCLAELYGKDFEALYLKIEEDETLEFKKVLKAKDLFKQFLKTAVETGLPYVFYKDSVNRANPNKHKGMIGNCNLCCESFSNFSPSKQIEEKKLSKDKKIITQNVLEVGEAHTCNLVSLNLSLLDTDEDLTKNVELSVRILDNVIDLTKCPFPESNKHNSNYRILGIGSLGLADFLAKRGITYHTSAEIVDALYEKIAFAAVNYSCELAKTRGVYPNFENSDWAQRKFFGRNWKWYNDFSKNPKSWKQLRKKVKEFGMRNGGLFCVAPNTSTCPLIGASAAVWPIYKKFYINKAITGAVPICPPFLNKETFWTYVESQHMDQQHVINVVSKIQKWVDQGISMELLLNLRDGMKAKDIYALYMNAWKKGCKTVYYARTITQTVEERKKEECLSCAN